VSGKKRPSGATPGKFDHQFVIAQAFGVVLEAIGFGQSSAELAKRPAINQANGFKAFFTTGELA
jgi:hypothetical protein